MATESLGLVQGTVDVLILRALTRDPMHGYAISQWIRDRSDGALAVEDAALYQALHRLERKAMGRGRVGHLRHRPAGQVLPDHPGRPQAAQVRRRRAPPLRRLRSSPCSSRRNRRAAPPVPAASSACPGDPGPEWRPRSTMSFGFHLDMVAARLRADGMSDADARAEAVRRFGDLESTQAYCRAEGLRREREKRRMTMLDELGQDLRYALRALRRSPGFTLTALITLALGIGANTAIFSVVRGVLLEPLPFDGPDRIARVWHVNPVDRDDPGRGLGAQLPRLARARAGSPRSMGGFFFADGLTGVDLTGQGEPQRLSAALVTDGFFETLRTPALLGRTLLPEDNVPGQGPRGGAGSRPLDQPVRRRPRPSGQDASP